MDRSPRAVTASEVEEAKASVEESLRRQGASGPAVQRIMASEFASNHPVMAKIIVDDARYLWVSRYTNTLVAEESVADAHETWDVFDPDGRLKGRVILPSGFRANQVSGHFVVGVHTDDAGLERVRMYRVHRQ